MEKHIQEKLIEEETNKKVKLDEKSKQELSEKIRREVSEKKFKINSIYDIYRIKKRLKMK